jgi:hypothetical protein
MDMPATPEPGKDKGNVSEPTKSVDPWLAMAGTWRDHPDAAEFQQNMKDYRREVDEDQARL